MLFLFFSIFVNAQQQIEIGQTYEGIIATSRGDLSQKVFTLKSDDDLEPKDLILMTNSLGPYGKPIIAVFSEQVEPFNHEYADVLQCTSDGIDICAIPYDSIIRDHTYYIVLFCDRYCNYQFKVLYQSELQMRLNDTLQFRLKDQQESEFITINTDYALSYYNTLDIIIKVLNFNSLESPFYSYLNLNSNLPSTEVHEKKGEDTWNGVQLFTISSDEYYFNPIFSLLVVSQPGSIIQIETKTFLYLRPIKLFEEAEGIIYQNEIKHYLLNLTDEPELDLYEQKELEFEVTPYMGHVNLFINNGNQPPLLNQYQWNSSKYNGSDILISHNTQTSKIYYLAIIGVDAVSGYQLIVSLANENEINLDFNKRKSGILNHQEVMNFHLNFYLRKQENTTLYINFYVKLGFINMIIKNCNKEEQCNIDSALSVNPTDKNIIQISQQKQEIYQLNVTYQDCKLQHTVYYCSYNLGLYPNPLSSFSDHLYMIEVNQLEDIQLLRENTPLKSFVKQDQYQFYKIIVKNSQSDFEVRKLQFILTPIQGEAVMYLSTQETKPTNNSKFLTKSSNNLLNYGEFGDQVQEGTYFLGVHGIKSCLYTITANLIRSGEDMYSKGIHSWNYIQLYEGDLHRSRLGTTDESLFKIDLYAYTQDPSLFENRKVTVQLEQEMGNCEILGFDHPEKDSTKYQWKGKKELVIQSSDPLYPEILFLKVRTIGQFSYHSFQIFYSVGNNPKQLIIGQPYYGFKQKEQNQEFWLQYYKQEELKIVKWSSNFDQSKLIVSLLLQHQEVLLTDQCIYTIPVKQLPLSNCSNSHLDLFTCSIQIRIYSLEDMDYIIYISKSQQAIKLIESQVITNHIPINQDYYYFYISENQSQVIIQSESTELQIFANINILSLSSDFTQYPTADDYQLKSISQKFQFTTSLFIDHKSYDNYLCLAKVCKVALTVQRAYISEYDNMNSTYRIMFSSRYIKLNENSQYLGHISQHELMFFETHVPSNESTLSIIVNPLSSTDLTILVKKNKLPSLEDFDWSSQYEDQLIIEPGNIIHPNMEGDYFIGIYSYAQTNFTIQVNYQNIHFYKLYAGTPFVMTADTNSIVYLNYKHTVDLDFTIQLYTSMKATQRYYLAHYRDQNELSKLLLSNLTQFQQIDVSQQFVSQLQINKSNPIYKVGSYYLIAVQVFYYSQISAFIKVKNEIIYLSPNTKLIQQVEKDEIILIKINPSAIFNITAHLYYGDMIITGGVTHPSLDRVGNLTEQNQEKSFTIESNLEPYIIQIYSQQPSFYKLSYFNLENSIPLQLGKPFSISFQQQRTYMFHYKSAAKQDGCIFQLLIEDASAQHQDTQHKYKHPIVNIRKDLMENQDYLNSPHNFEQQFAIEEYYSEFYQSQEYSDTSGLYFIEIVFPNQHQERQNHIIITLTNTENSIRTLSTFKKNIVNSKVGQIKLWEIYLSHPSQIFIIGQMCGGFIEIYGSQNLSQLEGEQYQQKITHISHKQIMGSFYVDYQGVFYIESKLVRMKNSHINNSQYIITPYILHNDTKIDYKSIEPGNEGSFYYDYGSDYLKVVFQQIKWISKNKDAFQINQITYYLIYEIVDYFEDYSINLCLINKQNFQNITIKGLQTDIYQALTQQIVLEADKSTKLVFTILAEVEIMTNNKEIVNLNYLYDTNSINHYDLSYYTISKYLEYIVYLILIFTLLAIAYLVKRRLQIQNYLQAQQYDVRADQLVPEGAEMSNI